MLTVVLPTVTGREQILAKVENAYRRTLAGVAHEIVVVKDKRSWPAACNAGYRRGSGEIVHFGADDLEPLHGWYVEPLDHLARHDELPAAFVWNHVPHGDPDNVADGRPGDLTHFTRVPILRRDQYDRIGRWPLLDYCADVWLSERARFLGIETRLLGGYRFIHHWSPIARIDEDEARVRRAYAKMDALRRQGGLIAVPGRTAESA